MTQKQKDILLKDLCARLPYGVKVQSYDLDDDMETIETLREIDSDGYVSTIECDTLKHTLKPYLFPMSSMTEEQQNSFPFSYSFLEALIDGSVYFDEDECITLNDMIDIIQWCYKNHFDIYGLIPMGLAIDATGLNIY